MVAVREAEFGELSRFFEMEKMEDTAKFIIPYNLEEHRTKFNQQDIIYLSIISEERLAGFIVLLLGADGLSVEFRRIVVSIKGKGIGQAALEAMENYCRAKLGRKRVWLDVFEFNERGRYIYEKRGYIQFNRGEYEGKPLLYYEKAL